MSKIDADFDEMGENINAQTTVASSAAALVNGLCAQLDAGIAEAQTNGVTQAQIARLIALSATIKKHQFNLADAVINNIAPVGEPAPALAPGEVVVNEPADDGGHVNVHSPDLSPSDLSQIQNQSVTNGVGA